MRIFEPIAYGNICELICTNNDNVEEDSVYDTQDIITISMPIDVSFLDKKAQICLDKSIIAFKIAMNKIAMNKIADIMESVEDNWIIYEILMQHRNTLHTQIDMLIKEKKKI